MEWVSGFVLTGWAAIVAVAWNLADKRIGECNFESECMRAATETRDAVLIWGPGIWLLALVVLALFGMLPGRRVSRRGAKPGPAPQEAKKAETPKLR